MVACISDSLYCEAAACEKHLPDIKDTWRRAGAALKSHDRRPTPYDIEVYSFPQGWGSTALGFGGIGGQAMTSAQTTVVMCSPSAAVYFGRRLAYVIKTVNGKFMADLASHAMSDVRRPLAVRGHLMADTREARLRIVASGKCRSASRNFGGRLKYLRQSVG